MKIAYCLALLGLSCGIATAQPMTVPGPGAPRFSPPIAVPVPLDSGIPDPLVPMGREGPTEAKPPKDRVRVTLEDGSMILGEIDGETKLSLKAKIGDVEIAMREIARIDQAFIEEDQFTVTLSNGDRLTGKLTVKDLKLKTAWGELGLKEEGLFGLEVGKLFEESAPQTRRSIDGRTTVTVARTHFRFQPTVPGPNSYPTESTYSPYTPGSTTRGWSVPSADARPVLAPTLTPAPEFVPAPAR